MAALVAAVHVFFLVPSLKQAADGRHKAGHDVRDKPRPTLVLALDIDQYQGILEISN